MSQRIKYAVLDGPWWSGNGEVSLFWGNEDGDHIEDIPWPADWPQRVDGDFLKQRGFVVETA